MRMAGMPTGTVTFLFTDIEGSTVRWEHQTEAMRTALARHDALLRAAILEHGGYVVKTMGDAFHAAFSRAPDAVAAAVDAQHRLLVEPWDEIGGLRVRMALHTGAAEERDGDYYGPPLNRAARLLATGHGGQVLLSDVTAGLVRDELSGGLELLDLGEHRLKDLIRPDRVFQVVTPGLCSEFPPLLSLDARPNNLPTHVTPLLGRERELEAARERLLRDDVRLLTLVGPGGTGKTRLSLQLAAEVIDRFEDGVFFVALAAISDPDLVASTVAQTFGMRDGGGRPVLDGLKQYLRAKQVLLLLDNFEQILAAAPVVAEILNAAPLVKILVTSRSALQVRGEHEYAVPPLALPDARSSATPEALSQYSAVALFIERAAAIKPDFAVTNDNAPAVAEICHRLDGLPLAIELAAARIRFLSPPAILSRLERRLPLLTGGARDLPARQQTLRSAIAWSYDLLTSEEQALFRRLAIFMGGCTFEAAEAVCNADGSLGIDVLDGIGSLVAQSLLQEIGSDAEPRFGMLETIREFGLEALALTGGLTALQRRHAEYFLAMSEAAEPLLRGSEQVLWLDRLEAERDNMRAVLDWSLSPGGEAELGLRLSGALAWFWYIRSHVGEARRWFAQILGRETAPSLSRVKALTGAARLAHIQQDSAAARPLLEEGLAIAHRLGDVWWLAWTQHLLGRVAYFDNDAATALLLGHESLANARKIDDAWLEGWALHLLGLASYIGDDLEGARRFCDESLAIRRRLGHLEGISLVLSILGLVDFRQGDFSLAKQRLVESLDVQRGLISGQLGNYYAILAALEVTVGQPARGARIAGAVSASNETFGISPMPIADAIYRPALEEARQALGDAAFAAEQEVGRRMSLDEIIAEAHVMDVIPTPANRT